MPPNHDLEDALLKSEKPFKIFVDAAPDDDDENPNIWHDTTPEGLARRSALEDQMGLTDIERQTLEALNMNPSETVPLDENQDK